MTRGKERDKKEKENKQRLSQRTCLFMNNRVKQPITMKRQKKKENTQITKQNTRFHYVPGTSTSTFIS